MTVINGLHTSVPSVGYAIHVTGRLKERRYINCDLLQQLQQQRPFRIIMSEKAWEDLYPHFD